MLVQLLVSLILTRYEDFADAAILIPPRQQNLGQLSIARDLQLFASNLLCPLASLFSGTLVLASFDVDLGGACNMRMRLLRRDCWIRPLSEPWRAFNMKLAAVFCVYQSSTRKHMSGLLSTGQPSPLAP